MYVYSFNSYFFINYFYLRKLKQNENFFFCVYIQENACLDLRNVNYCQNIFDLLISTLLKTF